MKRRPVVEFQSREILKFDSPRASNSNILLPPKQGANRMGQQMDRWKIERELITKPITSW